MKRKIAPVFLGLAFIAVGVLFITDQFFMRLNFRWSDLWPLLILLPCLYNMLVSRINTGNVIGFAIGAVFLLKNFDVIPPAVNTWALLISIIVIIIGLSLIFGAFRKDKSFTNFNTKFNNTNPDYNQKHNKNQTFSYSDTVEQTVLFWGADIVNKSQNFNGAKLSAIFGGIDIDLSEAAVNHDIIINASAVFGGIDITLPGNVNVVVKRSAIFGGVDCSRENMQLPGIPTVYIYSSAVFGGVDIN